MRITKITRKKQTTTSTRPYKQDISILAGFGIDSPSIPQRGSKSFALLEAAGSIRTEPRVKRNFLDEKKRSDSVVTIEYRLLQVRTTLKSKCLAAKRRKNWSLWVFHPEPVRPAGIFFAAARGGRRRRRREKKGKCGSTVALLGKGQGQSSRTCVCCVLVKEKQEFCVCKERERECEKGRGGR